MQITETNYLNAAQKERICQLWNEEYPAQLAYNTVSGFDAYLNNLNDPNHYLLTDDHGIITGWAFTFLRDGERWFAIILDKKMQYQGNGTSLLNGLKKKEQILNGWATDRDRYYKQNGEPYRSPLKFYEKNGFTVCHDIRLEVEILSAVKITWRKTSTLP